MAKSLGTSRSVGVVRFLPRLTTLLTVSFLDTLGGSTIVVLFEKGVVEGDEDLLVNSRACLETLVRVGMGLGRSQRKAMTDGAGNGSSQE